jgi:hypothetical protein
MSTMPSTRTSAGLARWASLGGVLYVVLFIVGNILLFAGSPASDAAPAKVVAWYSDSGHRDRIDFGWILAGLGIFCFLWFLSSLRRAVSRYEGEDGFLTALTTIGGAIYAALSLTAIGLNMGIRTMSDDTYRDQVFPGLIHAANDAGYVIHATGGAGAAAMIIAASIAALRGAAVPAWSAWVGVVLGILALASIAFFPQLAIALWILAASLLLFLRGARHTRTPA